MVQSDLGEASPKSERDWKSNLGMKKCKNFPIRKSSLNSKSGTLLIFLMWGNCIGEYRYGKNNAEPYGSRLSNVSKRI